VDDIYRQGKKKKDEKAEERKSRLEDAFSSLIVKIY